jgi:hypothetical protein
MWDVGIMDIKILGMFWWGFFWFVSILVPTVEDLRIHTRKADELELSVLGYGN